jgi:hypothetical protein
MSKQTIAPDAGHRPSTVAEIQAAEREIAALDLELMIEAQGIYEASRKGGTAATPLSEHDRRVGKHLQKYLNGATPARFLGDGNISRDAEIRAHRDALAIYLRDLARRKEDALYAEAEQWASDNAKEWRAICREIVLTAERLRALEEHARNFLEPIEAVRFGVQIAMGGTVGSGLSLLGTGDPLSEIREAAIKDNIVTEGEIRKAQKL